jgi:hypothetical protein
MNSLPRIVLTCCAIPLMTANACASKLLALNDGRSIIYATANGQLQRWEKGRQNPSWSTSVDGVKQSVRSHIALLAKLSGDRFIVVERFGDVSVVDASNPNKSVSKFPLLDRIKLDGEVGQVDLAHWDKHIAALDRVAAAALAPSGKLFLSSYFEPGVTRLDIKEFFKQQGEMVRVFNWARFSFSDDNFIMSVNFGEVPFAEEHVLPAPDPKPQTALAVCGDMIVAGTGGGTIYFFSIDKKREDTARIRQLSDEQELATDIIDAGCLAGGLAFTVSFHTGNGQVQLWNVGDAVMLDNVDTGGETNLITFQAVASSDGKRLLGVGDTRLRVWSTERRKLDLLGQQRISNVAHRYSAAALPDGRFVIADGERFWTLSSDGKNMKWFAGKRE